MFCLNDCALDGILRVLPVSFLIAVVVLIYKPRNVSINSFHVVEVNLVQNLDEFFILSLVQILRSLFIKNSIMVCTEAFAFLKLFLKLTILLPHMEYGVHISIEDWLNSLTHKTVRLKLIYIFNY